MLSNLLKKTFYNSPVWLKKMYGVLPYQIKFGSAYYNELEVIDQSYRWDKKEQDKFITDHLISMVTYAYENVAFYKDLYDRYGIDINHVQNISDFEKLPVINKKMLRETTHSIVSTNTNRLNSIRANTGGSSGEPFSFILPKNHYYRAWAYKTDMWGRVGYKLGDPVLSLRGHQFEDSLYQPQPVYNFYYVDSYQLNADNISQLADLIQKKNINFIHGYPSNIIRFIELLNDASNLSIKGILPCSEKVDPQSKKIMNANFDTKIQPSYEQSEMTILASYGKKSDKYYFYPTYGYPELLSEKNEVIKSKKKKGKLVGTTFSNKIMPLIRYETGDEAIWAAGSEKEFQNFKCAQEIIGRIGEYIDVGDSKISVTGLIYGQHLPIFDVSNQIQLYKKNGSLILFYVKNTDRISENSLAKTKEKLYKSLKGNFNVQLIAIEKPFKTRSGKKKILLGEEYQEKVERIIEKKEK